jgi:hypothetical protein
LTSPTRSPANPFSVRLFTFLHERVLFHKFMAQTIHVTFRFFWWAPSKGLRALAWFNVPLTFLAKEENYPGRATACIPAHPSVFPWHLIGRAISKVGLTDAWGRMFI